MFLVFSDHDLRNSTDLKIEVFVFTLWIAFLRHILILSGCYNIISDDYFLYVETICEMKYYSAY